MWRLATEIIACTIWGTLISGIIVAVIAYCRIKPEGKRS